MIDDEPEVQVLADVYPLVGVTVNAFLSDDDTVIVDPGDNRTSKESEPTAM